MAALSVVVEEVFHYYVLLVAPALRRPRTRGVQLAAAQLATFWTSSNEGLVACRRRRRRLSRWWHSAVFSPTTPPWVCHYFHTPLLAALLSSPLSLPTVGSSVAVVAAHPYTGADTEASIPSLQASFRAPNQAVHIAGEWAHTSQAMRLHD